MPQKWGNISGFDNLHAKDLKKYHWYPMADWALVPDSEQNFSLIFLPEREVVVKSSAHAHRGMREMALAHLSVNYQGNMSSRDITSDVMGVPYQFSNTPIDHIIRLTCLATGDDYDCVAKNPEGISEHVVVPNAMIPRLLESVVRLHKQQIATYIAGVARVNSEDKQGLRALMDTNFVELYDE